MRMAFEEAEKCKGVITDPNIPHVGVVITTADGQLITAFSRRNDGHHAEFRAIDAAFEQKDQKQDQQKDKNKQDQENKDDQKQNDDQQQNEQNQEDQQGEQGQGQQQQSISREDAKRLLDALSAKEKATQEKVQMTEKFGGYLAKINDIAKIKTGIDYMMDFRNLIPEQFRSFVDPTYKKTFDKIIKAKGAAVETYINSVFK